ncbi:hypothetical protein [Tuberibacillus sp. Marseille-P3662]|uniref:hypothetical protein n=1 Tax=Tuberibacillus sp. Marseille-P3662 TaxID=1965358 RepID=UPI000A1C8DCC|nr:hypothetical protein [Tuberibacillus sp. Marseille-P3662]
MKKATQQIVDRFPFFKEHFSEQQDIAPHEKHDEDSLYDDKQVMAIQDFNDVERTFFQLACFFEHPEKETFDLAMLYTNLQDDWLAFALQLITSYFKDETQLIKSSSFSIVRENDDYLNQSQFAAYLQEQGLKYDRIKLNVYYGRGKLPEPDQKFANKPYWLQSTVERFCASEKKHLKD